MIEKRKGISCNRNNGARKAKGRVLVFLDADTKPSPGLLQAYHDAMLGSVVAATGPILPLEKSRPAVKAGYKFVSIVFVKASMKIGMPSIIGSNFAVLRSAYYKVGGFDESLATYEDYDLSLRLKRFGRIVYVDDALVYASTRRVQKWGILGYFLFHVGNMWRYHLLGRAKTNYETIR